jgi:hypothetical protein
VFKIKEAKQANEVRFPTVPLELVKRFSAITKVEFKGAQTEITFEPMVNPTGILREFKDVYPEVEKIDFEPLSVDFLGRDGYDFVGYSSPRPSGRVDLHLRVKGPPKRPNFVRVKIGRQTWNNRSYGVNHIIKVVQDNNIFDLYLEPTPLREKQNLEVYFIYEDGELARAEIAVS